MSAEKLRELYYNPENLWTGRKAIKLLQKESGLPKKAVAQKENYSGKKKSHTSKVLVITDENKLVKVITT